MHNVLNAGKYPVYDKFTNRQVDRWTYSAKPQYARSNDGCANLTNTYNTHFPLGLSKTRFAFSYPF